MEGDAGVGDEGPVLAAGGDDEDAGVGELLALRGAGAPAPHGAAVLAREDRAVGEDLDVEEERARAVEDEAGEAAGLGGEGEQAGGSVVARVFVEFGEHADRGAGIADEVAAGLLQAQLIGAAVGELAGAAGLVGALLGEAAGGLGGAALGLGGDQGGLGPVALGVDADEGEAREGGEGDERGGGDGGDAAVATQPQAAELGGGVVVGADEATGDEAAQVLGEGLGGGVAGGGLALHGAADDRREGAGGRGGGGEEWFGATGEHGVEELGGAQVGEGRGAGEEVVEDGTEGVDVAAGVDGLAAGLLGRHVADRSEQGAGGGDVGDGVGGAGIGIGICPLGQVLGEAPVDDDGLAELADEDVGGLEVAVDDAVAVGVSDGVCGGDHLREQGEAGGEALAGGDALLERAALDELHAQEGAAELVAAEVVEGDDAGVLQAGGDRGLAGEALDGGGVEAQELLDGDRAAELAVLGAADGTEAAAREHLGEAVAAGGRGLGAGGLPRGLGAVPGGVGGLERLGGGGGVRDVGLGGHGLRVGR